MGNIPIEIKGLISKYIKYKGKRPKPFNYDEWNNFKDYQAYLEREIKE